MYLTDAFLLIYDYPNLVKNKTIGELQPAETLVLAKVRALKQHEFIPLVSNEPPSFNHPPFPLATVVEPRSLSILIQEKKDVKELKKYKRK